MAAARKSLDITEAENAVLRNQLKAAVEVMDDMRTGLVSCKAVVRFPCCLQSRRALLGFVRLFDIICSLILFLGGNRQRTA